MALADVVAAHAALLTGVTTQLGEEYVQENAAPPRVVWVPTAHSYDSAGRVGASSAARHPRSWGTRVAGVDLHVWAAGTKEDTDPYKDLRACELLCDRVLFFLRVVAFGSFVANGGQWLPVSRNHAGRTCVLRFLFNLPIVPAAADDSSVLTSFTNVDGMEGTQVSNPLTTPTGDVTGEPAP